MAYWLFKSEPGAWSWDDQMAKGEPNALNRMDSKRTAAKAREFAAKEPMAK